MVFKSDLKHSIWLESHPMILVYSTGKHAQNQNSWWARPDQKIFITLSQKVFDLWNVENN